jgi:hypothetical protein
MSKNTNTDIKEYNIPFCLAPKYKKECNELLFYFPSTSIFFDQPET